MTTMLDRLKLLAAFVLTAMSLVGCRDNDPKAQYRKMFGSIIVPAYRNFDEPEAPSPTVYLIADMQGKIIHMRRHRRDRGLWKFDELKASDISSMEKPATNPAFVIAADKSLGKAEFLNTLRSVRALTSQDHVWIQVWGAHPYALQIPLDMSAMGELETKFSRCQCLQEIVDCLTQPELRAGKRPHGRTSHRTE